MNMHEHQVSLRPEAGGMAQVICNRCQEPIGRLQVAAPAETDQQEWAARVEGEIGLVCQEHDLLCPQKG